MREHLMPYMPITFIQEFNHLGFVNKKSQLDSYVLIEPYAKPQETFLIPSSSVYSSDEYALYDNEKTLNYKQFYNLVFFFAPKSNAEIDADKKESAREKNRGILQIFEVAVTWTDPTKKNPTKKIDIVNQKLILNVSINGESAVTQNIDDKGHIDGIKIFDEISSRLLVIKRTQPYQFPFQNEITFSRYQKFYKHKKPYENDKAQILLVETQLTDKATNYLNDYMQMMVLNNAIRVLLNTVPYTKEMNQRYDIPKESEALQLFM